MTVYDKCSEIHYSLEANEIFVSLLEASAAALRCTLEKEVGQLQPIRS